MDNPWHQTKHPQPSGGARVLASLVNQHHPVGQATRVPRELTSMLLHHTELGSGEPLIVLHGLLGSHQNLLPACRAFAEHFHVFAIDQRNHGHSPHHDDMSYGLMAEDIARFMDKHLLATAHVLGHSMGGKTAMQFALNHPERIRKLIVEKFRN